MSGVENSKREIGSEFWLESLPTTEHVLYVLSGRTAIDLIIQDILSGRKRIELVYMPAWCCDSMLKPFRERNISICFYDVYYRNGELLYEIDEKIEADILYVTNFFGYNNTLSEDVIRLFKKKESVILYDNTHSLLRNNHDYKKWADYSFASIRKWMGVPCGALLVKYRGLMTVPELKDYPYLREKTEAMEMKKAFISRNSSMDKRVFLDKFAFFSHHLSNCYQNFKMDNLSQYIWLNSDKEKIAESRISNSILLQKALQEISEIAVLFRFSLGDCPLFFPILFKSMNERDQVRQFLINESIYCPIHWPRADVIGPLLKVNELYNRELSLICDHRYSEEDMLRIVRVLKDAMGK